VSAAADVPGMTVLLAAAASHAGRITHSAPDNSSNLNYIPPGHAREETARAIGTSSTANGPGN